MIRASVPPFRFTRAYWPVYKSHRAAVTMAVTTSAESLPDFRTMTETLHIHALRVPKSKCNNLMKRLSGHTLEKPRLRCVVDDGTRSDTKLLLLSESVQDIATLPKVHDVVQGEGLEVVPYEVTLNHTHFSTEQILKKLLPEGLEIQTSFESVGHIAHVNLRTECIPYKHLIGQVLLAKNPSIRTVVNKLGSIENEFRVFDMEVIAGEPQMETEVVQHKTKFRLDFSKVYWNSRLETEHKRLVGGFHPSHVVVDMMAGIGPFAIPAAQKGCTVYANDLNPWSAHYLRENAQLNRVAPRVHAFNMDARAFVRLLLAAPQPQGACQSQPVDATSGQDDAAAAAAAEASNGMEQPPAPAMPAAPAVPDGWAPPAGGVLIQHVVMNLPASAVEFLDAFRGVFDPSIWRGRLPTVHCYTFKRATETDEDIRARVEHYLGGPLDAPASIHQVRDVAPGKLMLCVSFQIPEVVAMRSLAGMATPATAPAAVTGEVDPVVLDGSVGRIGDGTNAGNGCSAMEVGASNSKESEVTSPGGQQGLAAQDIDEEQVNKRRRIAEEVL